MNKIASYLFFNKFYINLAVILQIAICLSFVNYSFGVTNSFYSGYKDSYYFDNTEYFMSTVPNVNLKYDKEIFESTGSIIEFNYPVIAYRKYNIYSLKQKTLEIYVENYLVKGKYSNSENGIVNCLVVGDSSMLNNSIDVSIGYEEFSFNVCGVLSKNTKQINRYISGSFVTPGEMFEKFDDTRINIICLTDDIEELYHGMTGNSAMVYFGENSEPARKEISKYGFLFDMTHVRNNAKNSEYYTAINVLSYLSVGVGIVGLISMISMFFLNIKDNESVFITFNQLGIRKKHVTIISTLYMMYFYLVLIPISVLLCFVYKGFFMIPVEAEIGVNNIIFTIAIILFTYLTNVLISNKLLFTTGDKDE